MNNTALLSCQNLSKSYREGWISTDVLNEVNFELYPHQLIGIVGSSGSGKSTLLHLLSGLDAPSSGEIFFKGKSLNQLSADQKAMLRNQNLGFIYQFHHLLPDFTALENVAMPLLIGGARASIAKSKAKELLAGVGLLHRSAHRPAEMSGGERQRVAIARALVNEPALVMADEPTGNLDRNSAETVFSLLKDLNRQKGTAFLVVTHDLGLAEKLDRQFTMQDGRLWEQKSQ